MPFLRWEVVIPKAVTWEVSGEDLHTAFNVGTLLQISRSISTNRELQIHAKPQNALVGRVEQTRTAIIAPEVVSDEPLHVLDVVADEIKGFPRRHISDSSSPRLEGIL